MLHISNFICVIHKNIYKFLWDCVLFNEEDYIRDVLICLSRVFSSLLSRAFKEGGKA